jgi:hypothetical protein
LLGSLVLTTIAAGAIVAAAPDATVVEVRVQRGDTLISLLRDGADWTGVQRANRIADPKRLQPGTTLRIPAALLREQPTQAEVVHAYGQVSVTRATTGATSPLAAGDNIATGDVVRTGAQSSATLRFADGARVLVRPDSELKIDRLAQSRAGAATTLRLQNGSADSTVPPADSTTPRRYEMRTPQANLGVRGTEFRTATDAQTTRVEVLEGRVAARRDAPAARTAESLVAAGFGAVSAAGAATGMGAPRALPPAPALTGLPERIERLPLRLSWQAEAGARVRAQVYSAADNPPRLLLDGVFDTAPARWNEDLPDGRYELRVRSIAADGLEGRDTRAAFELDARPEPPFIAAPAADSRTIDDTVRLAWTRNAGASRVRLQIADTPDFAAPRVDRKDVDEAELRIALPLGTHHWRVASITPDGEQGPFSDAQRFTRIEPPPAPPPAQPQTGADGVLLRWPAAAPAGTRWQVQVAREATFSQAPLLVDTTVAEPELLLREPAAGDYFVRVKTIDADGFAGPFGQTQRVEVPRSPWWWLILPAVLLLL